MAGRAQAWREPILLRELVNALAVVSLAGLDLQTHFLAQIAGKEAAHGMGLPAGGFHEVFQSGAAGPLHQFQHPGGFTALADSVILRRRNWAGRFGGFFGRGGLLGRLRLDGRNAGLRRGDFGVLGWLRLPSGGGHCLGRFSIFRDGRRHGACSFGGDYRRHDMDHSEALALQEKSLEIRKRRWNGDARWKTVGTRDEPASLPRPLTVLAPAPRRCTGRASLGAGSDPN